MALPAQRKTHTSFARRIFGEPENRRGEAVGFETAARKGAHRPIADANQKQRQIQNNQKIGRMDEDGQFLPCIWPG